MAGLQVGVFWSDYQKIELELNSTLIPYLQKKHLTFVADVN